MIDSPDQTSHSHTARLRIIVRGAVQGVGFRPFVYRLASELRLAGWVRNASQGVFIEVEGAPVTLREMLRRIAEEKPPRSFIQSMESSWLDPVGATGFEVRFSEEAGEKTALVLPDIATCPDCLREILDPSNRRYRYPFTNCTNCGPRFSIIEGLPYDRAATTMRRFSMCDACHAEYENPADRRFHAQPNACPVCGPHLEWWDREGGILAAHDEALLAAAQAIRNGAIVALKGLGGFQFLVDARNDDAVRRLRQRKGREEKPFALMVPSLDLARHICHVHKAEQRLLESPESPIVLLRRTHAGTISPLVAPDNPTLGLMLPYTPLHCLLMRELDFPIVATSGNRSDEPICTDEREALDRLAPIADFFLVHDRPIARHVDDSIVRVTLGRELVLRRARGYAPLPVPVRHPLPPLLAVGGHLKNTVAISIGQNIFVSQHIGDLETEAAFDAFHRVIDSFERLYEFKPKAVACDAHPGYASTQFATQLSVPVIATQHHYAHVLSCMAENDVEAPALGISWDGTGHGLDDTVWGGEFLRIAPDSFERVAHFRTFRLPGGEAAVKEPRRVALGLLHELLGDSLFDKTDLAPLRAFTAQELAILRMMLFKGLNAPLTSSAGRLFDAVSSILGLRQITRFEGQSAMELEFALETADTNASYPFDIVAASPSDIVDWGPMVHAMLEDRHEKGTVSATFHNTLAEIVVCVAKRFGEEKVVLTGGCFQNAYLTARTVQRLSAAGFRPYWHQRIPPNDGGIALGQIIAAARATKRE